MKLLSIIICTYNRSRLVKKCLDSLLPQMCEEIEIIVIDNNSTDETADVTKEYSSNYQDIRYVFEENIGLSHARNRGINESKADWILYLDDDAIAFPDLVERALYLVNRGDFDCVGGMYYGYYEGEKPKWIHNHYGTKTMYSNELTECPFYEPHGGIVLYKKESLINAGYFFPGCGMNGNKISFGEETEIQKRIFALNSKIGFDPYLKIWHLNKRTNLKEQLIMSFELGKSHKIRFKYNLFRRIIILLKSIAGMISKRPILVFFKFLMKKEYFWQNVVIDLFSPVIYYLGRI